MIFNWQENETEKIKLKFFIMDLWVFKYFSRLLFKPNSYSISLSNKNAKAPVHWIFLVFLNCGIFL